MTKPGIDDLDRSPLPPAPGGEDYVALDFADSAVALPGGRYIDLLGSPDSAGRWLAARGLAPTEAGLRELCVAQLRALREQVRALIASRIDMLPAPRSALQAVNDALTRSPTSAPLDWDQQHGLHRVASHPTTRIVDHALALLAANAADLLTGPDADHLAACGSPPCNRYLLRTHGRRQWCSVRCGDRARAARAYARTRVTNARTTP